MTDETTPSPGPARITSYTHDGLTFDVRDAGPLDGDPVILLHGFPETSGSWAAVIPHLTAAGHRVLAPDQRGYSPGARPSDISAYRIEELTADVLALADAAGAETFHLVGHDWGGGVAWHLAAHHPGRVRTLCVLSTPHPNAMMRAFVRSTQGLRSWYMVFFQLPRLPEKLLLAGGARRLTQALERSGMPASEAEASAAHMRQPGAATAAVNWYRALRLTKPARMPKVSVPTTYVWSTGDVALGRWAAAHTGDETTGPYRYEVFEGVSHWLPEEVPDRVAAVVLDRVRS